MPTLKLNGLFGGMKIKCFRVENNLKFWKSESTEFYQRNGIIRHRPICNIPHQYEVT